MSQCKNIPDEARTILDRLLLGYTDAENRRHSGLEEALLSLQQWIENSEDHYDEIRDTLGEDQSIVPLHVVQGRLRGSQKSAENYVEVIKRLRDSIEMEEAYQLLSAEFTELSQWRAFFYSTIRANIAYDRKRKTISHARNLTSKIAKQATQLAENIMKLESMNLHGLYHPLSDVQYLLYKSEVAETVQGRTERWENTKARFLDQTINDISFEEKHSHYFPESRDFLTPYTNSVHDLLTEILQETTKPMYRSLARKALVDAPDSSTWTIAPDTPELLTALAEVAKEQRPEYMGMIGEATASRERNPHNQYVRALAYILQHDYEIELSTPIRKAIPVVTNVVINDKDSRTSYDNLRKLLASLAR